ncbi:hypothetical protein T02_14229 [Trichinella nativa]|uniref:Uncharacterized protein n=1 Tax=Trichinella nativa TaxID=6335 RepID=A0A0V1KJT4_9BILA|nr:hypothetical protein T02_14229 [Trichinella nativa]
MSAGGTLSTIILLFSTMCELQICGSHWHLRHVNLISTLALTFRSFSLNFNNFEDGILFWKGGFADVQRYVMLWLERSAAFTFSCSIYCYVSGVMHMVNSNIQISITEAIEYSIYLKMYGARAS